MNKILHFRFLKFRINYSDEFEVCKKDVALTPGKMVKCPRGTPYQIRGNLAGLNKPGLFNIDSTNFSWVYDPVKGQMVNIGEKETEMSVPDAEDSDWDSIKADKRCPPTSRDELVYFLISFFLDILLESWDGKPCVKPKVGPSFSIESMPGEDLGPCESDLASSTADFLRDLYVKRSSSLSKDKTKKESETTESEYLHEEDYCSSVSLDPLNLTVPDEEVHFVFKNGVWYKGRVSRRLMEGEGLFFWEDGATFQGDFEGGCVTGKGRLEFPDLSVYEGGVYKAFRHGEGMFCFSDSPITYSGEWWLGKKHGQGLIVYNDPSKEHNYYKGQWQDGFKEGFGFRQYPSGAKYTGFWSNGKRNGKGVMFWSNNDIYRGEWRDGLMHGYGEYTWSGFVNKSLAYPSCNIYRGYWAFGKRHGRGLFELKNGPLIETNWVDDMKEGLGAVICENGFVIASERMFHNDKPTLRSQEDSARSYDYRPGQACRKRDPSPCDTASASIPILAPVYTLNLNPYLIKLFNQQQEKLYRAFQESQMEAQLESLINSEANQELGSKQVNFELTEEQECSLLDSRIIEEKRLRNYIILKMAEFRNCYDYYSTLACETPPSDECVLLRLFLWQLFIDAKLSCWNLSLIDIDNLIAYEEHILIDSPHNPFERLQFWQFIQILISLSWHLYSQFVLGEPPLIKITKITEFLKFYKEKERKIVLKTGLEYFLTNDVFKGRFGEDWLPPCERTAFKENDLAPMKAMYIIYTNIGEPHSARDFLSAVCQKENDDKPWIVRYFEKLPFFKIEGKNALIIGGELQHISGKQPFNYPELIQLEENKIKVDSNSELTCFNNLKAKRVVKCLIEACPGIMIDDCIVNINYQLTFLEFYKTVILCTKLQLKLKAMDAMRDDLIANYKTQMEEYKKQLVEYEKLKENSLSRKKSRQLAEAPKKGKK